MYKQTLCVTLPISAAVIIAAALFANAGDLDPPKGPIEPTMHDLQEIYDLVQQSSPCGGCTWEYKTMHLQASQDLQAVAGTGVLHGIWLKGEMPHQQSRVRLCNGPCDNNLMNEIGDFIVLPVGSDFLFHNEFFLLDIQFDQGLQVETFAGQTAVVTFLYRSTNP